MDQAKLDAMIAKGQKRINEMLAELPADGIITLPFRCYGCDRQRYDFCLMTGDGLPMCRACFEGCVEAIGGVPEPCEP